MNALRKGLRALICEDEGMTVIMLRQSLEKAGCEVVGEAGDGQTAIEMAARLQPDFILMDINMPRVNGLEATRRIMSDHPLPIIILTAYNAENLVAEAIDAGACTYLVKPIVSEQLLPAIKVSLVRFDETLAVMTENADLKDALETRKLVERAKGILMERSQLNEADAFKRLQKLSRDKSQTMKQTALQIIEANSVFS